MRNSAALGHHDIEGTLHVREQTLKIGLDERDLVLNPVLGGILPGTCQYARAGIGGGDRESKLGERDRLSTWATGGIQHGLRAEFAKIATQVEPFAFQFGVPIAIP